MKNESLLRAEQIAARLDMSVSTLRRRVRDGRFPAGTKYRHNVTRWPAEVLAKWLAVPPWKRVPPCSRGGVPLC